MTRAALLLVAALPGCALREPNVPLATLIVCSIVIGWCIHGVLDSDEHYPLRLLALAILVLAACDPIAPGSRCTLPDGGPDPCPSAYACWQGDYPERRCRAVTDCAPGDECAGYHRTCQEGLCR